MERPFDTVINYFSESLERTVKYDRQNHEFLHSFSIWILGFSLGGLSLLFSNFLDLKTHFSHTTLKTFICLLAVSIITGILHRLYLFAYQTEYNSNLFYIEGALSNRKIMPNDTTDISNESDINKIIDLLQDDFNEDLSYVLHDFEKADEAGKSILLKSVRDHYMRVADWASRDYQIAFDHINTVLKAGLGLSDKEIARASNVSGKRIRMLRIGYVTMLYLSYVSFIFSIILLSIIY